MFIIFLVNLKKNEAYRVVLIFNGIRHSLLSVFVMLNLWEREKVVQSVFNRRHIKIKKEAKF